jgi:hypothetical protein
VSGASPTLEERLRGPEQGALLRGVRKYEFEAAAGILIAGMALRPIHPLETEKTPSLDFNI